MVACLNQGKSAKGSSNSSPFSKSQNPCREAWVTSAVEVLMPGMVDLFKVYFNHGLRVAQLPY
jgi:hypothetical protein